MIKSNELRIGNWVYMIDEESEDSSFLKWVTASILSTAGDDLGIDFLDPIPLIPEILEKFGFEKGDFMDSYGNKGCYQIYLPKPLMLSHKEGAGFYQSYYITPLKYLHQLQNLYFTLTGEELEINL